MGNISIFPEVITTSLAQVPNGDASSDTEKTTNKTNLIQKLHIKLLTDR